MHQKACEVCILHVRAFEFYLEIPQNRTYIFGFSVLKLITFVFLEMPEFFMFENPEMLIFPPNSEIGNNGAFQDFRR